MDLTGEDRALDPARKKLKTQHNGSVTQGAGDDVSARHPAETLRARAAQWRCDVTSREFAERMDASDPLRHFREKFHYPLSKDLPEVDTALVGEEECVYFCGNSLGLMPKTTPDCINRELDKWAKTGTHGRYFGVMPWEHCDEVLLHLMATLVGAKTDEVGLMNGLTVNLHLLLVSFYEPTATRHKILIESKAFPSDHYAVESQIRLKGYSPDTSMVCLEPRAGKTCLHPDDVIAFLEREGESVAVVMLPGVQYYTGQLLDMRNITEVARRKGCVVGWDLAHAVGNVPLYLHDWGVDFACWCTYKYLCSGAGGIAGAFIHERHATSRRFRLTGWWAHRMATRFDMDNVMDLSPGIAGYRVSNPPPLLCASLEASLKIYNETSMETLRAKSLLLTAYLELLLIHYYPAPLPGDAVADAAAPYVTLLTPSDPTQRGAQLSTMFSVPVTGVFEALKRRGVVLDHRKPNVLRLAPLPMYNSFVDVHRFVMMLGNAMLEAKNQDERNGTESSPNERNGAEPSPTER